MYLLVNSEKLIESQSLNSQSTTKKIKPVLSTNNNWIVNSDLLTDCENTTDIWYNWKDWLLSLTPTDEIPKPRPEKPKKQIPKTI